MYNKKLSLSTPKNNSFKRCSLSKSRKSDKIDLQNFLNAPFVHRQSKQGQISTSAEPEHNPQISSPFHKLFSRKHTPQTKPSPFLGVRTKPTRKTKKSQPPISTSALTTKQQLEQSLKQDIKLRVHESVQLGHWMELLREYRHNVPEKMEEVGVVMREIQKIVELKEQLEIRKYRLISSMI